MWRYIRLDIKFFIFQLFVVFFYLKKDRHPKKVSLLYFFLIKKLTLFFEFLIFKIPRPKALYIQRSKIYTRAPFKIYCKNSLNFTNILITYVLWSRLCGIYLCYNLKLLCYKVPPNSEYNLFANKRHHNAWSRDETKKKWSRAE